MAAKVTSPTLPAPAPVISHVVSDAGPATVSQPAPPSKVTVTAPTALESIVSVSFPFPPTTTMPVSSLSSRLAVTPSSVTTAWVAVAASEIE